MPAIMMRPAVGSSEKVSGRISATPATGPKPGSTPIAVPAKAPTNAASRLPGVAATPSPYIRPCSEFMSEQPLPQQACGHLHLQQPYEEPFEDDGNRDRIERDAQDRSRRVVG